MKYDYETKEMENQPRLKNFNLNIIMTCNILLYHWPAAQFVYVIQFWHKNKELE